MKPDNPAEYHFLRGKTLQPQKALLYRFRENALGRSVRLISRLMFRLRPSRSGVLHASFMMAAFMTAQGFAQDSANAPTSVPAAVSSHSQSQPQLNVSEKQAREADDAYIEGAKHVEHHDLAAAEASFQRAVQLNPTKPDYIMALADVREHRLTQLVQDAARARLAGDNKRSDSLLAEARALDPDNTIVTQHLGTDAKAWNTASVNPFNFPAANIASTLSSGIEFQTNGKPHTFHQRGSAQDVIRAVYSAYGITNIVFDTSVQNGGQIRFDLENADFETATRVLAKLTHIIAIPVQPTSALIAKDTQENRDKFVPQLEETVYIPGISNEQVTELANVARNIFDLKSVTASSTNGDILIRGDEPTLKLVNATFADILDGDSDVLFDIRLLEIQKTRTNNYGAELPSSVGAFSIAAEAESLVNANQSLISQAVASGLLVLNGSPLQNLIKETIFLVGSGAVNVSQVSNLLGTVGGGLGLTGVYLGSNTTFNMLLSSTDVRLLDQVTLRSTNHQPINFRAGTKYPVITGTYSSGISSSALSGLSPSLQSLAAQYLGSSTSVSIPQFQYEDLGITIKATPYVHQSGDVMLDLDMKLEALAGQSLNNIPILQSRAVTSKFTVPLGETAMIASLVSDSEMKSIDGLPGLSELPGFVGTDKDIETAKDELLITITPHLARSGRFHIASRPLSTEPARPAAQ